MHFTLTLYRDFYVMSDESSRRLDLDKVDGGELEVFYYSKFCIAAC